MNKMIFHFQLYNFRWY